MLASLSQYLSMTDQPDGELSAFQQATAGHDACVAGDDLHVCSVPVAESRYDDVPGPGLDRAAGVQVGSGNVQVNYFYSDATRASSGTAPLPSKSPSADSAIGIIPTSRNPWGAVSTRWTDPGSPWGVFGTVFAFTALPFGVIMGTIDKNLPAGMISGFFFGLLFGAAMIPFLRVERHTLPVTDRSAFEKRLKIEMSELYYTPTHVDDDYFQFRAPTAGVWKFVPLKNMSGESLFHVSVHLDKAEATVIGPRWMVRKVIARV